MTMTDIQSLSAIESRLSKSRGEAASFRADLARLDDDRRLALYQSKSITSIDSKREGVRRELDALEFLIVELESRLPAEERDRYAAELVAARAAEEPEAAKVAELRTAVIEAERQLSAAIDALTAQQSAFDSAHGKSFSLDFKIRGHRAANPQLYGGTNT